jgi:beta-glucanase (GH16 family)
MSYNHWKSLKIEIPFSQIEFYRCTNAANLGCKRTGNHEHILNPIKSAKVGTLNSFAFKYGKVEIAAKLPSGDWLLPSIKFLPLRNVYGSFPASGEIDLLKARGNRDLIKNGVNIGNDQITSSLHYGPYANADAWQQTSFTHNLNDKGKSFASSFHRYQMEWTSDKITFSVDDIVRISLLPFYSISNFIFSCAIFFLYASVKLVALFMSQLRH